MQSVKTYRAKTKNVPECPDILRLIAPKERLKIDNAAARPGAKMIYLWYENMEEQARQERVARLTIVPNPLDYLERKCESCRHYHPWYEESSLHPGQVITIPMGRCNAKSVRGTSVKCDHACKNWISRIEV